MKKIIIAAAVIIISLSATAHASTDYAKRVGGYFYTALAPHGTWIEIGFGTPVWRPVNIRRGWSPYSLGQWVYTNYGWYWDSYEDFGYIVYHYGRWYYDDYYGWIWIPDYEWAPAWVDWRYDNDYIGWAPLSPYALFSINIGIHYTYNYYVPYQHWNYVKYKNFCSTNVYSYYVAPKYKYRIYNQTKVRTNYSYYDGRVRNDGVDFNRIRESNGRNIQQRDIVTFSDPNEITKVRNNNKNDREIRTYIANKEDISRDGLRDIKIDRQERKSTLDLSKVELGRNRTLDRKDDTRKDETREVTRTNREKTNVNTRVKTDDTRKETSNDVIRKNVEDQKRVRDRIEVEKNNSELEKRNLEQNKRTDQMPPIQKRAEEEMKQTREVLVPKRNEKNYTPPVNQENNERRIEQKQETQQIEQRQQRQETQKVEQRNQNNNTSVNKNTEVRKNETNTRTETKRETRTTDQNNRTRTR